jgi:hypothetical protein
MQTVASHLPVELQSIVHNPAERRFFAWALLGIVVIPATLAWIVWVLIFAIIIDTKDSAAYSTALEYARLHPTVVRELGTPVRDAELLDDSTRIFGTYEVHVALEGPKGRGEALIVSEFHDGRWRVTSAKFKKNGRVVDIYPPPLIAAGELPTRHQAGEATRAEVQKRA